MSALPSLRFPGVAGEQWVTSAQLVATGQFKRQAIAWNCAQGDLQHCHRWRDNPRGGPKILEINLTAPTCPERYRQAMEKPAQGASEFGEAHTLTERQLAKATRDAALLEEIEALLEKPYDGKLNERARIEAFLAGRRALDESIPSIRHYYRLKKRWLAGGRTLAALADGRAVVGGGVKVAFDEEAFALFCALYLQESQPQATTCYDKVKAAAEEKGWAVPSISTVIRTLDERVSKSEQDRLRKGAKYHRDRHEAHLLRDWKDTEANHFWVSDHCLIDVIGIDDLPGGTGKPARMWLTTWMDEASRFIVSWRVHRGPNAVQVLCSFFSGLIAHYIPLNIRIDNGKEYRCMQFAGGRDWREHVTRLQVDETAVRPVLYDLGITPHFAMPYNARAKIIEPWHRHCVKEQFSKFLPGYCGGSVEEKPEQLAAIVAQWHKKGTGLLAWSQIVPMLAQVIEGYQLRGHDALQGNCPAFVRQQKLSQITPRVADERTAALFLETHVVTCGTFLNINGTHFGLGNPKIIERQGEKVRVRMDAMNAGRAYVYDLKGLFITVAENAGRADAHATPEHVEQANRIVARHNKLAKQLAATAPIVNAIDPAVAIALQSKRGATLPEHFDPPIAFKPDFTARADDGTRLPALPASPAPEEPSQLQVTQRMDSSDAQTGSSTLPENLLDLLSAG